MKKLLFDNFWVTLALMFVISIGDLVLLTDHGFGFGFILTAFYFAFGSYFWMQDKKVKK